MCHFGDLFTASQNISIQSQWIMDSICGTINGEIRSKGMQNGVENVFTKYEVHNNYPTSYSTHIRLNQRKKIPKIPKWLLIVHFNPFESSCWMRKYKVYVVEYRWIVELLWKPKTSTRQRCMWNVRCEKK